MQKTAIRYHRFSDKDQSNGSIERQDMITSHWCSNNNVHVLETFSDEGYTARNFDRPDMVKLRATIKSLKIKPDYLVVAELTRFSRQLGDGVKVVEEIQQQYGVKIVSATRNMIYDVVDPTSLFMMGIEFSLGNVENLKRASDINGGIYTAKVKEQRYIGSSTPYGFIKEGNGVHKRLVIVPDQAHIVTFIFRSFINGMPLMEIYKQAKALGFTIKGNSAVVKVLQNPIYSGQQVVKAYKDMPGGLFPFNVTAIIDMITWHQVQQKLKGKEKIKISLEEMLPLKGVLHCTCGRLLTGAPSKGRQKYYYYYKCNTSSNHNNISATFAHKQMQELLKYMSIPSYLIESYVEKTERTSKERMKANTQVLASKTRLLSDTQRKMQSVEEKFINNQLNFDTYNRWFSDYRSQISYLQSEIEKLSRSENETWYLVRQEISKLEDLQFLYNTATIFEKQTLLNMVFDSKLYYSNSTYRTPYIMEIFTHNTLILKQKQLLLLDEKKDSLGEVPVGGHTGNSIEHTIDFLAFIRHIKVA